MPTANAQIQARLGMTAPRIAVTMMIVAAVIPVSSQVGRVSTHAIKSPNIIAETNNIQNFNFTLAILISTRTEARLYFLPGR